MLQRFDKDFAKGLFYKGTKTNVFPIFLSLIFAAR